MSALTEKLTTRNNATSRASSVMPALPVMAVVFLSFIIIGMALPVLPLHVHDVLGFGPLVVGIVAGGQFAAALISRLWAGRLSDSRGAKYAVALGLIASVIGGVFLYSLASCSGEEGAIRQLDSDRTDTARWRGEPDHYGRYYVGLGLVSNESSGKVIAWVGMAMFAAMAAGAPLGSFVFERWAFLGIAIVTVVVPIAAFLMIRRLPALVPKVPRAAGVSTVLGAVALPGLGFALSGITFGAVTSFLTLYFAVSGWNHGALAFTTFAVALIRRTDILERSAGSLGGAKVALYCLVIQAIGLAMIGLAGSPALAIVGAAFAA